VTEAAVMEKSVATDESSVENKIKWKIIFPERRKMAFKAGHEEMG
jgi:hypothetical protein